MKIKTAEASGQVLDWLVAKCECVPMEFGLTDDERYSTNWAQGGPLIEREFIAIINAAGDDVWSAYPVSTSNEDAVARRKSGPTPLIAAMRCYVSSKLGEEVEVPDELAN